MTDGIHFSELLDYLEGENQRLKQFFSRHPQAFNLPLDILPEMRKLVLHIFEVELFFAKAAGERGKTSHSTLDQLFGISEKAANLCREFIATTRPESWSEVIQLNGRTWKASRRKMLAQARNEIGFYWLVI
jgi:hypothetical protein